MMIVSVYSSVITALLALFLYFTATYTPINIEPLHAKIAVVVLAAILVVQGVRNMIEIVVLPGTPVWARTLALITKICAVLPLAFASVYQVFERLGSCIKNYELVHDPLHFSYTTLTTLGYGDLSPVGACRIFTAAESIIGYFFLGIMVSFGVVLLQEENRKVREMRDNELRQEIWKMTERALADIKSESEKRD